mgnify:CR=1 FL=1
MQHENVKKIRPSSSEVEFLTLAYKRFYDLFDEIIEDSFWNKDEWERYSKICQGFFIYTELLNYESIKQVIEKLKTIRPPMESEIGSELFKFIRNLLVHFPLYCKWNDVWVNKSIVNWHKKGLTIDKFLKKYAGAREVKYRFWEEKHKRMTYLSINFPMEYNDTTKVYLKDIVDEQDGIKFSFILMKKILDTQVEK